VRSVADVLRGFGGALCLLIIYLLLVVKLFEILSLSISLSLSVHAGRFPEQFKNKNIQAMPSDQRELDRHLQSEISPELIIILLTAINQGHSRSLMTRYVSTTPCMPSAAIISIFRKILAHVSLGV
jgi:hypothetical protein